ncbi:PEBP-like protein [Gymnopus androsaceus JB14]|uniref:PEBP-like protein n=1 Tax=Gymnopus androsaceus JB14 TaxID=1447944 RepID=A0A6A4I3C4_9AGAR|nr:PEBP-like protein [Gymnopus androsaceus JB14]
MSCQTSIPGIHPSLDLHLTVPYPLDKQFKRSIKSGGKDIVRPRAPGLWAHAWHLDVRLYTMVMLDPDVPDEETSSFTTYLHWMKPNIPVSALTMPRGLITSSLLNSHTRYVPPHPQKGTPYHRYTVLLLPQPAKSEYSMNTEARFLKEMEKHRVESEILHKRVDEMKTKISESASSTEKSQPTSLLTQSNTTGLPLDLSKPTSWPLSLLKKYTTSQWLDIPVVPDSHRRGFNLRSFVREWGFGTRGEPATENRDLGGTGFGGGTSGQTLAGLRAQINRGKGLGTAHKDMVVVGGGAHMFREVWDETVSGVFEASLNGEEEKYALPKKEDRYEGLRGVRKYV